MGQGPRSTSRSSDFETDKLRINDDSSIIWSKLGVLGENRVKVKGQGQGHMTLAEGHVNLRYTWAIVGPYRGDGTIITL